MRRIFTLAVSLMLMLPALSRDKYDARPLSEIAIAALQGRRLAVSRHEMPKLSVVALIKQNADWRTLRNVKADPSDLFERELAPAIAKQYGMERAQTLADADYLLDILVTDRRYQNIPDVKAALLLKEEKYWSGFGIRVQLKYRESGRSVFAGNCYSDTFAHPNPVEQPELAANNSRLFRDVFDSLAWRCLRRIAQYLPLADDALPATPAELVDPLAAYAATHPRL
jgi:hypothetical protein